MKKSILSLVFISLIASGKAQELKVNSLNESNFSLNIGNKIDLQNSMIYKEKSGNHFGTGALIGLGSGLLVSIIKNSSNSESWYLGVGKTMLITGGIGGLIGLLIPKYKTIEVTSDNSSLKLEPLNLHAKFTF